MGKEGEEEGQGQVTLSQDMTSWTKMLTATLLTGFSVEHPAEHPVPKVSEK